MSVTQHPSDALMLDYAAGNTGAGADLAIATHLAFCPTCRGTNRVLECVGGHLIASAEDVPAPDMFERILAQITPEAGIDDQRDRSPADVVFPAPLRAVLGCDVEGVPWKRLGMGAYHHIIPLGDPKTTARLLRIPADRPVPVHTHRGTELTLVLSGAFSDATGRFGRGDFQEADDSLVHQPHAAPGADCICLAVTEAPLRFRSWIARLVQPFLDI